jgi:hypothetical protein
MATQITDWRQVSRMLAGDAALHELAAGVRNLPPDERPARYALLKTLFFEHAIKIGLPEKRSRAWAKQMITSIKDLTAADEQQSARGANQTSWRYWLQFIDRGRH